jgi:hypothetical protein
LIFLLSDLRCDCSHTDELAAFSTLMPSGYACPRVVVEEERLIVHKCWYLLSHTTMVCIWVRAACTSARSEWIMWI